MSENALVDAWQRVTAVQPVPPAAVVAGSAGVAIALVLVPGAWRWTRHLVTIAHEGGHAVAAALSGRRLAGIRLHSDTSGLTVSRGPRRGPGMVITALAGYVAPALLGLGGAALLANGRAVGWLWLLVVLLALLLVQIRNFFGAGLVALTGFGVFAVTWWLPADVQSAFAYGSTWFLLLAAVRPVLELQALRRRGRAPQSDADQLARLTRLPGLFWVGVFLAVTLGAGAVGAGLLIGRS